MGLLDDAIREHLELKRQRGADASEVARQEHEAFGPIQRPAGAVAPEEAPPAAPEPVADAGPVDELDRAPAAPEPDPFADFDDDLPPEPVAGAPGGGGAVRATFDDDEPDLEWAEPPRPAPAPPEGEALERAGQPTAEYDVEDLERLRPGAGGEDDEPEVVPADEGEDVLEETPEFLSETPEHDRLWFEQRPPRDFDF